MPTTEEILDSVAQNLSQPRRARTDAGEVEQHDLAQQVMAARFVLDSKAAAATGGPFAFLRKARIEYPGASG